MNAQSSVSTCDEEMSTGDPRIAFGVMVPVVTIGVEYPTHEGSDRPTAIVDVVVLGRSDEDVVLELLVEDDVQDVVLDEVCVVDTEDDVVVLGACTATTIALDGSEVSPTVPVAETKTE
jgi:hypothetical protein